MRTNVVLAMAGPYHFIGRNILKACVDCGTDYADITGETFPYVRDSVRDYNELAKKNGARIVHCCGFDSVPSDLLARKAILAIRNKNKSDRVKMMIACDGDYTAGEASGGTLATACGIFEYVMENKHEIKNLKNPFLLGGEQEGIDLDALKDVKLPGYSTILKAWYCPFIMAGCNTKIVRRSMTGLDCEYQEVMCFNGSLSLINATKAWFFTAIL